MKLTRRSEKLISDLRNNPCISEKMKVFAEGYYEELECEICGTEPLEGSAEFICSIAKRGWGEYWAIRYHVCLDCANAGIANFPDRLRDHAEALERRAQQLRELAAANWRIPIPEDAAVYTQDGVDDEIPF